jgi:hypothetical protein
MRQPRRWIYNKRMRYTPEGFLSWLGSLFTSPVMSAQSALVIVWNNTATLETLSTVLYQPHPKETHGCYLTQCNMERWCCHVGGWHGNRYLKWRYVLFLEFSCSQWGALPCSDMRWLTRNELCFTVTSTLAPGRREGSCHLAVSLQTEMNPPKWKTTENCTWGYRHLQ